MMAATSVADIGDLRSAPRQRAYTPGGSFRCNHRLLSFAAPGGAAALRALWGSRTTFGQNEVFGPYFWSTGYERWGFSQIPARAFMGVI